MPYYLTLGEVLNFLAVFILVLSAPKVIWIFKYLLNIRRQIKIMAETGISGPPAYNILGNLPQVFHDRHEDIYYTGWKLLGDSNPITRIWLGPFLHCCVKDPRDIELVLNGPSFSEKSFHYGPFKDLLGDGLLALPTSTWKRHRRAMNPSFHLRFLQEFVQIFHSGGRKFADNLESLADKTKIVDVAPLCGRLAFKTLCRTVLSSDIANLDEVDFPGFLHTSNEVLFYRGIRPWYTFSDWLFSWTNFYAETKKQKDFLEHFSKDLIDKRSKELSNNSSNWKVNKRLPFVDAFLSLSNEEFVNEVNTILFAGSSTTLDALSFIMYTLAIKQEIQDKVYQELRDIFGDDPNCPITYEVLPHMDYLERVIKETFRFFPVVPVLGRTCSEDTKMPTGGTIPKGATAFFFTPYTYMDPANFPNPNEFDPDRFLPEVARTRHPYSYVPFSGGPKNCIGQRYAMMFMKTFLATILLRVRLVVPEEGPKSLSDVPITLLANLSVKGGAWLKFERRALSLN